MRYFSAIVVTFLIIVPVHAQTADLQAELNALLAQLAALQAQLQTTPSQTNTTVIATGASCPALSRVLRQGLSGSDVSALQSFLAADRSVYPESTVSGYFGALTQAAVQRFQVKHGIVNSGSPDSTGYGVVGPATRAAIVALCRNTAPTISGGGCTLGGITVSSGATHTFYSTTQAPLNSSCAAFAATRQCVNGGFSGNAAYQYRSCIESEGTSCAVDGERVAHGTSFTFYSKRTVTTSGEGCSKYAQTRTCTNGVLSGSADFKHIRCFTNIADSCTLGGVTVADGQSRTFYRYDAATSTNMCSAYAQTRTCNDGTLSGSNDYTKASCAAGACTLDGVTYAHGSSSTFYLAQTIPATEQCSSYAQTRTCSSGSFSGNASYQYRSCAPVTAGSCVVDNVVLSSGQSRTFYTGSTAPTGTACSSIAQTRTCTNGSLSGSATYNRATCSDTASCSLDGVTVAHGSSATFYSVRTVAYGTTCSSKAQVRTCTNGQLSGSTSSSSRDGGVGSQTTTSAYQYASCSVSPPTP